VTVTFSGGCTGTGLVAVTVNPAFKKALQTITICEGETATIFGQTTDVPGIYTLNLQQLNGCDSIITQELKVVSTSVQETAVFCPGGSVMALDSTFTTEGSICKTEPNANGCLVTTCVTVRQVANPQVPEQDMALVIALDGEVVIETPNGYVTYVWTPAAGLNCSNCPDPIARPDTSTNFLLVVTDGNGCKDTVQYRVFVCDKSKVYVPNAFTPNGDGANDLFRVAPHEGAEVINLLRVYNRWGQKVYEGSGQNAQWDGKIGDKAAPSDTYVWILDYECGGETHRENGDVTLLR
jgi:gliding motility-associated-like protein